MKKNNYIQRFLKWIKLQIGWHSVRKIGELKLLTKVSYLTLVFVPCLAVVSDGLNDKIEQFNSIKYEYILNKLSEVQRDTENKEKILRVFSDKYELDDFDSVQKLLVKGQKLNETIDKIKKNTKHKIPSKPLGSIWVRAFFAALFIGTGHLLYQLICPSIVQTYSEKDYVQQRKMEFNNHGTPREVLMAKTELRAPSKNKYINSFEKKLIEYRKGLLQTRLKADRESKLDIIGSTEMSILIDMFNERIDLENFDESAEVIEKRKTHCFEYLIAKNKKLSTHEKNSQDLELIERLAERKYNEKAYEDRFWIILSLTTYTIGIIFLIIIIISQIKSVNKAGGKDNMFEYIYDYKINEKDTLTIDNK